MLQVGETVISFEIFEEKFVCDLSSCKGECCIAGEEGAPLEKEEIEKIEKILPEVWEYLPEQSKEIIKKQGVSYIDREGENAVSIVNGAECVFMYRNHNGYAQCAIERACLEGKISFRKPISCYLYPIRIKRYKDFTAVNYHRWHVCKCALELGAKENIPVYKFLKNPLIEKFGNNWYEQVEIAAKELKKYRKKTL